MIQERLKEAAKVVGIILIFCIVGVGILSLDRILTPKRSPAETFESARQKLMAAEFDGEMYMRKNVETFLVSGLDKYESDEDSDGAYRNFKQADFNLLIIIDKSNRTISAINVNRDTMVETDILGMAGMRINRTVTQQLALAHTYGDGKQQSGENLRRAVSRIFLGVTIDHYVTMTMDAIAAFNDYLGGVTVTLEEDLSNEQYPTWTEGATVTVDGAGAMRLVRSRTNVSDGTNISRMGRQNLYIRALAQTIGEKKWDKKYLLNAYRAIGDYTVTDYSNADDLLSDLQDMFSAFAMFTYGDVIRFDEEYGDAVVEDEYMAYYLKEDKIKELVKTHFYRKIDENKD